MEATVFHIPEQLVISLGAVRDQKNMRDHIKQPRSAGQAKKMSELQLAAEETPLRTGVVWTDDVVMKLLSEKHVTRRDLPI